jgi:RNA recognition motif-containing protein
LENLDRINLIEHPERRGKNRGYAFLDFRTHLDAVAAFLKLQNGDLFLGTDFRAHVSFSNTLSQDDDVMEKVKSVFLDGLPPHWDEDKVREMFGKFGEIDSIQLARNMFTAKRKDFGFIGFTTRQSALDCIKGVNKDGVGEGSKKVCMKATLQRPRPSFKKPSWQGGSSMLGVRRGFVDKNYSGRVHHSDRHRHFSPERRPFSDNYPRRRNSMDFEERHVPMREYRGYYRRDSAARGTSHKYGRTHPGSRIREAYAESRYSNKYPKHRQAMHEEPMQRDPYRRSKYGHSYQERAHRISCPECDLCDDKSGAVHSYQYQNGEEFSSTSGCEQAYHKKDHEVTTSTSSQDRPLAPSSSAVMCDCRDCYIEQESSPSSTERVRTRSNLQAPLHRRIVKPSHEHQAFVPDEHSAFEVEYMVRESRRRYSSSRDAPSSHSRKHRRPAR